MTSSAFALRSPVQNRFNLLALGLFALVVAVSFFLPDLAHAASPWATGTTQAKKDALELIAPFAGIGLMVLGALCLAGRVNWGWFGAAIVGIVLIFGHDQIIAWARGMFKV